MALRLVQPEESESVDSLAEDLAEAAPKAIEQIPPPPVLPADINPFKPYGAYWQGNTYVMFYSQGNISFNYAYAVVDGKYTLLEPESGPKRRIGFR
jgi:hypothetical protein